MSEKSRIPDRSIYIYVTFPRDVFNSDLSPLAVLLIVAPCAMLALFPLFSRSSYSVGIGRGELHDRSNFHAISGDYSNSICIRFLKRFWYSHRCARTSMSIIFQSENTGLDVTKEHSIPKHRYREAYLYLYGRLGIGRSGGSLSLSPSLSSEKNKNKRAFIVSAFRYTY